LLFYETLSVFVFHNLFLYFVLVFLTWYQEHGLIRLELFVASAVEFPNVWGCVWFGLPILVCSASSVCFSCFLALFWLIWFCWMDFINWISVWKSMPLCLKLDYFFLVSIGWWKLVGQNEFLLIGQNWFILCRQVQRVALFGERNNAQVFGLCFVYKNSFGSFRVNWHIFYNNGKLYVLKFGLVNGLSLLGWSRFAIASFGISLSCCNWKLWYMLFLWICNFSFVLLHHRFASVFFLSLVKTNELIKAL